MPLSMASISEKSVIVQGEEHTLGVARPAQEERSGGEIDDALETELPLHGFEARDPEPRRLAVLLCLLPVVTLERQARKPRVGLLIGGVEVVEEPLALLAELGGDLGQPDEGLDGLDLAEDGRMSVNSWCRQCSSSRAVSGVTDHWLGGSARQRSTC
jgi:hypothetical protein